MSAVPDLTTEERLLIALKALLFVTDNPQGTITMGAKDTARDFARAAIEAAEGRTPVNGTIINGVPEGWYAKINGGIESHPLSLLVSATGAYIPEEPWSSDYIEGTDLYQYLEGTTLRQIG